MRSTGGVVVGDNGKLPLSLVERYSRMDVDDGRNDIQELAQIIRQLQREPYPKIDVPLFDGNHASSWADKFEQLGYSNEWTDEKMLRMVKRYCQVEYRDEIDELVRISRNWPDFKARLLENYQLNDRLLDMQDLRAVDRKKFGTTKQFLSEFERVARLIPDLSDKDHCLIFLDNFNDVGQSKLVEGMQGRYDWTKVRQNALVGKFDDILYRLLRQQKEERKKVKLGEVKDGEIYKTLTCMREMMEGMKEERLKFQVMLAKEKNSKRKGKEPVVEENDSESEEEKEPPRKPVLKRSAPTVAVQTRVQRRNEQLQKERESEKEVEEEPIPISENDEDNEDEKLRTEEEERARHRALERETEKEKVEASEEEPRKKKNIYSIPVEQGVDIERLVIKILESQRDLLTLKEILAVSPKIREEFKQRMTRKRVMTVKLGEVIPPEANWSPPGTKMDWRSVSTDHMKVQIGQQKYSTLVDDGAEMNIIREPHAIEAGLKINRDDYGFLVGASGSTPFCGTVSGVLVTVVKVKVRSYFYVLPRVEHEVLLGRAFLYRSESIIITKHDGTMFVILCNLVCGYYEVVKCANTGPFCSRNRLNPESYTFPESEKLRREMKSLGEESNPREFSLTLPDIGQTIDFVLTHAAIDPNVVQALTEIITDTGSAGTMRLVYSPSDGDKGEGQELPSTRQGPFLEDAGLTPAPNADQAEESILVDAFLKEEESRLSINTLAYLTDAATRHGKSIWNAPAFHEADDAFQIVGRMSYIMNLLIYEDRLRLMNAEEEGSEVKEAFKEKEYEGEYKKIGMWLNGELGENEVDLVVREKNKGFDVRDGHLFKRVVDGVHKRVVCGTSRQLDVITALHDGVAGGHRSARVTLNKIQRLYFWEGMSKMVIDFCKSCFPCQQRSNIRYLEPLNPQYVAEPGALMHLDLLVMSPGINGYSYIFDARDNLIGFVDGRAIRERTGSVLADCMEEYYLRYPFIQEIVMDRGGEFRAKEVQTLLKRLGDVTIFPLEENGYTIVEREEGGNMFVGTLLVRVAITARREGKIDHLLFCGERGRLDFIAEPDQLRS
ncbi:hypothetical protein CBR_g8570 [Chara braunii]|uniref:Integrase catalytic domain-containing protein n=1 Tax=Chara braunii TaxID=69332 RepID=A0A388JRW9_CHABU|nr:hypothetical protein CBR_g8570 [Chara braunii]|eukprot:GBG60546.1 hypothetical protein CBR_g8570 [Chara braunii]